MRTNRLATTLTLTLVLLAAASGFAFDVQKVPAGPDGPGPSVSAAADDVADADSSAERLFESTVPGGPLVTPLLSVRRESHGSEKRGVSWSELARATSSFLAMEHGFRLMTEAGTRDGLKGSFLQNYGRSLGNLHGWADGDEFYVNYIGHPMQGSVAGFIWVQNDRAYRGAVFGRNRLYWKSRLRAAAFAWAYSTQFEIGPVSEASLGAIQAQFPQQGFVDHVITPSLGLAWMIGEDSIDRYIIEPLEAHTRNRLTRLLVRSTLNPSRALANALNGHLPWYRDTRSPVHSYARPTAVPRATHAVERQGSYAVLAPPFEFAVTFQPERFWGNGESLTCLGGGATAGFRLASSWQFITDVGGCKMIGLGQNLSGDSLTYAAGPRWLARIHGPWSAHLQVLVGGNKISEERMLPELKRSLETTALRNHTLPPSHADYTRATETNGFAVTTGGGLNYQLNSALTLKVADVSYRYSWNRAIADRDYNNSLKLTFGLALQMGTW